DSIAVWGTNKPLPTPLVITTMDETNEGELVRMNSMTATTWPATWTGSGQNATISDGTNSFTLRIDADCNLFGKPQPSGLFDVLGLVGQFDNSSPYTSGYQLFPRDTNDIIPVVATSPTVRFVGGSATVLEGNVSHTVKMSVQPHLMTAGSVTVTATPGTGFVYGSDATTTPAVSGGTFTVNVPAMADTVSFVVNVLDDQIIEGNENLLFTLSAASTGLAIGAPSTFTFTIADNDVYIPTYTIPQVKGVNASFVPDSNGVMCKLQGTVLGVNTQTFASTGNVAFTIHDGSVGFGVFGAGNKNLGYTVNEGDVVRIIGVIGHFNGLAQINADSIVVLSTNAALPTPVVITALDESTESQLIRMNDVTVVNPTQWTNAGSGFTVDVTDGVNTIQLRIDADVADVYNAPCPVGTFDVVGIGGQFDNSAPHNSGYQFLPRYLADFIYPVPVTYDLAITEIMANSNDANGAVSGDWFEVTNYGSTSVDLAGFSWDDNSYAAGTVVFPAVTLAPGEALVVAQIDAANEAAFRSTWNLGPWVQVLVNEDFTVGQPAFSANGDGVALFDTSATPIEICRAEYPTALAGFSAEFDTACTYLGNASVGVRGAYTSTGGDVGSPGNQSVGLEERGLIVRLQPNPTTGLVQLQLPGVANYVITVRNLNGQILGQQQLRAASAEINLSGLARGMYLVEVVSEVGQSTQRIVLQ
ncbi:MAG: lamin tail domain-containing protein, partial [Schleiferiaceae bacterium]